MPRQRKQKTVFAAYVRLARCHLEPHSDFYSVPVRFSQRNLPRNKIFLLLLLHYYTLLYIVIIPFWHPASLELDPKWLVLRLLGQIQDLGPSRSDRQMTGLLVVVVLVVVGLRVLSHHAVAVQAVAHRLHFGVVLRAGIALRVAGVVPPGPGVTRIVFAGLHPWIEGICSANFRLKRKSSRLCKMRSGCKKSSPMKRRVSVSKKSSFFGSSSSSSNITPTTLCGIGDRLIKGKWKSWISLRSIHRLIQSRWHILHHVQHKNKRNNNFYLEILFLVCCCT